VPINLVSKLCGPSLKSIDLANNDVHPSTSGLLLQHFAVIWMCNVVILGKGAPHFPTPHPPPPPPECTIKAAILKRYRFAKKHSPE